MPRGSFEGVRFIQLRLAFFGKLAFALAVFFFVVMTAMMSTYPEFSVGGYLTDPSTLTQFVSAVAMLVLWLVARRKHLLSPNGLAVLDAGALFAVCCAIAWMARSMVASWELSGNYAALVATFGASLAVIARAVIVPSTARRTLWTTTVALTPLPIIAYTLDAKGFGKLYGPHAQAFLAVEITAWVVTVILLSTVTSRVIYGLHEKVVEAQQLGQYTLEKKIGEGGMGEVYRGRHALLRRPTAIKLISAAKAGETLIKRFEQEVQLTSELTHPNTISVFDYGHTPDGVFYYAMEYLDGVTLEDLVRHDGPQSAGRIIALLRQVCGALAEAHDVGLIHRDIKPANIFLCCRGGMPDVIKVLDFGLAKQLTDSVDGNLTQANVVAGTPHYMAPEAIKGKGEVDGRCDLYAVGAVAYYLLTGEQVFEADSLVEICSHHLHSKPVLPSERTTEHVPEDLEQLILECLAKDRLQRPPDARALSGRLEACDDADEWSEQQARTWWSEYETQAADGDDRSDRDCSPPTETPAKTINVDLQQRLMPFG